MGLLGSSEQRDAFVALFNRKIEELKDASTFKKFEHEKELSIEVIYEGRMAAGFNLRDFAQELLQAAQITRDNSEILKDIKAPI